ncbi:MAG: DUF2059 domain-containing protein [Chthoniobacteraceae bacterium]
MKKLLLALTFITLFSSISFAQAPIPDDKRQEIEKMLKLTGTEKMVNQMMTQLIASLKTQMPQAEDEFWVKFQAKLDIHQLIEKIIPIYDKYYTIDDLKAVNAFYGSPAGQKVLSSVPQIMQESMKIGQAWGAQVAQQAIKEIEAEKKTQ